MTEALAIVLAHGTGRYKKVGIAALGVDRWQRNKKDS